MGVWSLVESTSTNSSPRGSLRVLERLVDLLMEGVVEVESEDNEAMREPRRPLGIDSVVLLTNPG